jgi:hypothetical protein
MYEFYVIEWEGVVWLYDDNQRTHLASSKPMIYIHPAYASPPEKLDWLEPTYIDPELVLIADQTFVTTIESMDEEEAWQEALEMVCADHPM